MELPKEVQDYFERMIYERYHMTHKEYLDWCLKNPDERKEPTWHGKKLVNLARNFLNLCRSQKSI